MYVTLRLPPQDSETGWTGELCSKTKMIAFFSRKKISLRFLKFFEVFLLFRICGQFWKKRKKIVGGGALYGFFLVFFFVFLYLIFFTFLNILIFLDLNFLGGIFVNSFLSY